MTEKQSHSTPSSEGSLRGDFRKKPVVVHAVKWTGNNLREIIEFTGLHPSAKKWTWEEYEAVVAQDGLKIFTLEGSMMAAVGDWIIEGVQGEFYPCKPDIFAKTYEPASVTQSETAEWKPMATLPRVTERTEFLFRWSSSKSDHEVLLVWPDGVLTDHCETVLQPEDMPSYWMPLPEAPQ